MSKDCALCFSDDIKVISREIEKRNDMIGYFTVTVFRNNDGQVYHVYNSNYDEPMELLGRISLEKHGLEIKMNREIQVGDSEVVDLRLVPNPDNPNNTDKSKH